jgi:hypothetical protein
MFRSACLAIPQCFTADAQSQADKLVTFVYKLNGDEVKVEKSHYPK